ncbi:MAG TPA: MdtA/MuxA family multidrug efflux RND transporter periplasmic adaptor subunit [Candidatus Acidoferrales bacterium]|nr:MdtA/MuxA family multidrug efflux RND transporter periplasmic adaptor subunit [Candidatus Acidoferrales bacterium]
MGSRQTIEPQTGDSREIPLSQELALSPRKKHHWWAWVLIIAILGLAAWYFRGVAQQQSAKTSTAARARMGNQAVPVVVATARTGDLPVYFTGLGTVTAFYTVTVHTRVDGQIMTVYFREGQFVNKGEALVEIDPRPYQVQLEQAEGQLAKDEAALKDATLDYNRYTTLAGEGVIPKQQLDTQTSVMNQAQGAIKSDQASIDSAKLQLVYCHVTAPISGRIGLRLVDPGNVVHATDTTGLIVITQLQPIAVIFTLPQDELPEVYKELRSRDHLPVDAYDRDDTTKIESGFLQTMDNQIDTTTGTYKLKAVFNNENNVLFPNQFVNIHLLVNTEHNVTVIPAAAVQRGPNGTYVYVVNENNVVNVRAVKVGLTTDNDVAIDSGVQPGERVVTDGLDKLSDGSKIVARNATGGPAGTPNGRPSQSQAGKAPAAPNSQPQAARPHGRHGGQQK